VTKYRQHTAAIRTTYTTVAAVNYSTTRQACLLSAN